MAAAPINGGRSAAMAACSNTAQTSGTAGVSQKNSDIR